jgi:hypothetical protein
MYAGDIGFETLNRSKIGAVTPTKNYHDLDWWGV